MNLMDTGALERIDVGKNFYMSVESRRDRTVAMYTRVFQFAPSQDSIDYWSERLLSIDDVQFAIELGTSDRFYTISQG